MFLPLKFLFVEEWTVELFPRFWKNSIEGSAENWRWWILFLEASWWRPIDYYVNSGLIFVGFPLFESQSIKSLFGSYLRIEEFIYLAELCSIMAILTFYPFFKDLTLKYFLGVSTMLLLLILPFLVIIDNFLTLLRFYMCCFSLDTIFCIGLPLEVYDSPSLSTSISWVGSICPKYTLVSGFV